MVGLVQSYERAYQILHRHPGMKTNPGGVAQLGQAQGNKTMTGTTNYKGDPVKMGLFAQGRAAGLRGHGDQRRWRRAWKGPDTLWPGRDAGQLMGLLIPARHRLLASCSPVRPAKQR